MINTEEYKKFVAISLNQINDFLTTNGYLYQDYFFYKDSLNLEHVQIDFFNNQVNKQFIINYSNYIYNDISGAKIVIFIKCTKGRTYALEDILKYEKINYNSSIFSLLSYQGNFEEQVIGFYSFLIKLLKEIKLEPWIIGKKWEDIPFDWGRYK